MRVFVAGGTGAIGRHLIPALIADGHQVTASTRSAGKSVDLAAAGAVPVVMDGLKRDAVLAAVRKAAPEVIVHQMTSLGITKDFRRFDQEFAVTNELRTRGTDYLREAARLAGTRRFIAQSFTGFTNEYAGTLVKTEDDPLNPDPPASARQTLAAIRHVDETVPGGVPEGIVLRYGLFYGHGAANGTLSAVRAGKFPVIGGGTGIWSFCEITDAAAAAAAAVTRGAPGIYNIVDDEPAPAAEWVPFLARCLGAEAPQEIPASLGRQLAGEFLTAQMTTARGIIQREGEAGARLGTALRYLARRVPGMGEVGGVKADGGRGAGGGYAEHRPLLFSIAYRMTGSVSDAEDIVQEAFARLAQALRGGTPVSEPKAYLAMTATRLALNHLRSARLHRESYLGTWLPEPVLTGPGPEEHAEMADSLSMAFLVVLESLSPTERAVFLLHEVFGYEHKEIAEITGTSAANSRQILARARRHADEGKPRFEASRAQREEVARRFFAAADGGDLDGLLRALAPDVVYYADGGGKARAVMAPWHGRDRVARFLAGLFRQIRKLEASFQIVEANGQPGAVTYDRDGHVVNVFALDIADGVVQAIRCVVNPDKLRHLGQVSELARKPPPETH